MTTQRRPQQQKATPAPMAQQGQFEPGVREGNRWVGNPPDPAEVATWFEDNVVLHHNALKHADYIGGIVMIPQKEKVQRVDANGLIGQIERLVWTPYAKVETRLAYFWRLCELNGWTGAIEPVRSERRAAFGEGFFAIEQKTVNDRGQESITKFLGCSHRLRAWEPNLRTGGRGKLVLDPPSGTKIVPVVGRYGVDQNFVMKAETGSVGRALGMAGMLVIPGSGVATAEDMLEFTRSIDAAEPALPDDAEAATPDANANGDNQQPKSLNERVAELRQRVESDAPGKMDMIEAWAKEKKIPLDDPELPDSKARSLLRQLERALDES